MRNNKIDFHITYTAGSVPQIWGIIMCCNNWFEANRAGSSFDQGFDRSLNSESFSGSTLASGSFNSYVPVTVNYRITRRGSDSGCGCGCRNNNRCSCNCSKNSSRLFGRLTYPVSTHTMNMSNSGGIPPPLFVLQQS